MVTDRLMKEFLSAMPAGPISSRDLSRVLERNNSGVLRVMWIMEDLGMVERVEIRKNRYLWRKLVKI